MRSLLLVAAAACLLGVAALRCGPASPAVGGSVPDQVDRYRVVDLGLHGMQWGGVQAVTRSGIVWAAASDDSHAVWWSHDVHTGLSRDLPDPHPLRINDNGVTARAVVTGKDASGMCDEVGILLEFPDGRSRLLDNPFHGDFGDASCDLRYVSLGLVDAMDRPFVAVASSARRDGTYHWNGTGWEPWAGARPNPVASNAHGEFAGEVDTRGPGGTGALHAARWQDTALEDLGTLGGSLSFARDINESGQIVGGATMAGEQMRAFVWSSGAMRALEVPPGSSSCYAQAISEAGEVVGMCTPLAGSDGPRATLWRQGRPLELRSLLDDGSYAILDIAGMTRDGHVVVRAAPIGQTVRAVVLLRGGAR